VTPRPGRRPFWLTDAGELATRGARAAMDARARSFSCHGHATGFHGEKHSHRVTRSRRG
jgi:hypothetical protein